jgi:hypothetical protein
MATKVPNRAWTKVEKRVDEASTTVDMVSINVYERRSSVVPQAVPGIARGETGVGYSSAARERFVAGPLFQPHGATYSLSTNAA